MNYSKVFKSLVVAAAVGVAVTACSSTSSYASSTSTTLSSGSGSSGGGGSALAAATARTRQALVGAGTLESVKLGPITPPKKLSIVFVTAEAAAAGVAVDIAGLKKAAALVGYTVNVCAGGGTVAGTQGCIESAIQQHPTAIINQAFDPNLISAQIADAKKAGILFIGQFDGQTNTTYDNGLVGGNVCETQGKILGDAMASKSAGKAHALLYNDSTITCLGQRNQGIKEAFTTDCPTTCTTKTFSIQVANASAIPGTIHSSLTANPDTNWLVGPTDFVSLDAANEVRQSGKTGSVFVAGFDGDAPNLTAMKSGGSASIQKYDVVAADTLLGYLDVDLIMRLKAGQHVPGDTLHPTNKLLTPNTLPSGTDLGYHGPSGFQDVFKRLWKVQ
jgi:ABC-type sugar transport system substrate-binding protein